MRKSKEKCECRTEYVRIEPDEDATEGQIADYNAAQESGDYSNWTIEAVTCKCNNSKRWK